MDALKNHLRDTYHLSNYQVAQLSFLFKSLFSEFSKLVIMGLLFHRHLPEYFFALCIMISLRTTTGGLHFYTYRNCLLMSFVYIFISIFFFPQLQFNAFFKIIVLLLCSVICFAVGPTPSKYRPQPTKKKAMFFRLFSVIFIVLYICSIHLSESPFWNIGFGVITLHSLQLIAAKTIKKGGHSND